MPRLMLAGIPFSVGANAIEKLQLGGKWDDAIETLSDGTQYRAKTGYRRDDIPLQGEFLVNDGGHSPRQRMKQLDVLAASGKRVRLSYGDIGYDVEIRAFVPTFQTTDTVMFTLTLFIGASGGLPTAPAPAHVSYGKTATTTAAATGDSQTTHAVNAAILGKPFRHR